MNKLNTLLLLITAIITLAGCSSFKFLNEGAVSHRMVTPTACSDENCDCKDEQCSSPFKFQQAYFPSKDIQKAQINKNDSVSIHLMQAYICDFTESATNIQEFIGAGGNGGTHCTGGDGSQGSSVRGEIAVIANVTPHDGEAKINHSYDAVNEGRVIFYSEDVRETGQFLNGINLPIYGPITYNGSPLHITFTIIELDSEENQQFRSILSTITGLGRKAYPPSDPALGILDAVGGALLSGNQDDIEFRYSMELEPAGGLPSIVRLPLAAGYYALIRQENRNTDISWDKLQIDPKSGRLLSCNNATSCDCNANDSDCSVFRGTTYLTFKINKWESTIALDSKEIFYQKLSDLKSNLSSYTKTEIKASELELLKIGTTLSQQHNLNDGRQAIQKIAVASEPEKSQAVQMLMSMICSAMSNEGKGKKETLNSEQINYLFRTMADIPLIKKDQLNRAAFSQAGCPNETNLQADYSKIIKVINIK